MVARQAGYDGRRGIGPAVEQTAFEALSADEDVAVRGCVCAGTSKTVERFIVDDRTHERVGPSYIADFELVCGFEQRVEKRIGRAALDIDLRQGAALLA